MRMQNGNARFLCSHVFKNMSGNVFLLHVFAIVMINHEFAFFCFVYNSCFENSQHSIAK